MAFARGSGSHEDVSMNEAVPTIEVMHKEEPKPRPAPARAAAPADPAPVPPEIVTTITLKPGVKITIEYPA
jgi:hypothetical protein